MPTLHDAPRICPVLIGRDDVLDALRAQLARAGDGGGGRVALVTGEAGIGKSRLVAELKAAARAGSDAPEIVRGDCFEPNRTLPYAPLLDLIDAFASAHTPDEIAALFGPAPELAALVPAIGRVISAPAPAPTGDAEQEKRRLFQALAGVFARIAAEHPLLVVIEDIHWCDDTSLEFFLYLVRRIADTPMLLLCTYRSDEVHPALAHFLAMLDRERTATEYALARLTQPEVDAMLRAIFGAERPLRRDFAAAVAAQTDGNPFFVEEVVKSAAGAQAPRAAADGVQIPRSVQDAVRRRTARLDDAARELLSVAAVAGRRFDFALLRAVTGLDEAALLAVIKQLIAAQLVAEESAERFAFRHALTQQAVAGELLARERRALHRRIAAAIRASEPGEDRNADLAHHCYEAGAWAEALDYSRRVGERAAALHAPRAAVEHFTRALGAAWQLGEAVPADLYRARGLAYGTLGEFERARSDHEAALQSARSAGDRRAECQSLLDLGELWAGNDYGRAGEFCRAAVTLAREIGDAAGYARSLNRLANWLVNTGNATEALPLHAEALAIFADAGDARGMAGTYDLLGMASGFVGAVVDSVRHYDRAVALLRDLGDAQLLSTNIATRAIYANPSMNDATYAPGGDPARGAAEIAEAINLARQADWPAGEAFAGWGAAALHASHGAFGEALRHGEAALRIAAEIGHPQWTAGARWALGQTYVYLLLPGTARAHLEAGLPLARDLGSAWWLAFLGGSLAQAHLLAGDAPRAAAALATVLPRGAAPRILPERGVAWVWGLVALAERDHAGALRIADDLIASAPGPPTGLAIPWLARLRGDALAAMGRHDEAEAALVAAADAAAALRATPTLWQVQRSLGALRRRQRRGEEAERAYTAARATVATLAASLDDDALRARFRAAALATMPPARAPSARRVAAAQHGGLTARERDVAREIARGKSNRAIAETLFLSERTVATHTTHILGKLGLASRTQIAAWAVARGLDAAE